MDPSIAGNSAAEPSGNEPFGNVASEDLQPSPGPELGRGVGCPGVALPKVPEVGCVASSYHIGRWDQPRAVPQGRRGRVLNTGPNSRSGPRHDEPLPLRELPTGKVGARTPPEVVGYIGPLPPSSSGLGHRPFTPAARVRIPLGVLRKRWTRACAASSGSLAVGARSRARPARWSLRSWRHR